jgi:hypothetical protein
MKKSKITGMALRVVQRYYPEVTTVVDATKPLDIEVQPKDVRNVHRKKHDRCVLAEVCKNRPGVDGVVVAISTVYIVHGKEATRYVQGESSRREIVSFDRSGVFEPGIYRLRPPSASNRLGYQHHHARKKGAGIKRRGFRHLTQNVRRLEGREVAS